MLDGAAGAGALVRRQRGVDRRVADRVGRDLEAGRMGAGLEVGELGQAEVGRADRVLPAPGRAGVEGAVADDLERSQSESVVVRQERVPGAEPGGDHVVELTVVEPGAHPEQVGAGSPALAPAVGRVAELEVDHADDAERGRALLGAAVGAGLVVVDQTQPSRS